MVGENFIAQLNEIELSIYFFIQNNAHRVISMRIRDIAQETNVSTSTILRFCRKLHFEGFTEFRYALKQELSAKHQLPIIQQHDITEFQKFLDFTQSEMFRKTIDEIAKIAASVEHLIFIGIGNSGMMAQYAARYFSATTRFAFAITDPYLPIHHQYNENTAVILLSVSGETNEILQYARIFKAKKCHVISITNTATCQLAKLSHLNLAYYITSLRDTHTQTDATSQLPTLYSVERIAHSTTHVITELNSHSPSTPILTPSIL